MSVTQRRLSLGAMDASEANRPSAGELRDPQGSSSGPLSRDLGGEAPPSFEPGGLPPSPQSSEVRRNLGAASGRGLRRWLWRLVILAAVAGLVAGLVWRTRSTATPEVEFVSKPVSRGDLQASVTATGNLQGRDTVEVGAEVSGTVEAVQVDFNDEVEEGQLLCEIDPQQLIGLGQGRRAEGRRRKPLPSVGARGRQAPARPGQDRAERWHLHRDPGGGAGRGRRGHHRAGTAQAYLSHKGEPLSSFGGMSDFVFYARDDAYDYRLWADWAADHGMNHVCAYPPFSWRSIELFATDNGGATDELLFPYQETSPGSRQFDLDQFDLAYWDRFRAQLEYLESRGIIVHLLMINGWQMGDDRETDWDGHFFNPANNVNAYTDHLAVDRFAFYRSVADGKSALVEAQQRWFRKLIEVSHDLDNVYYDLVHEIAENRPSEWSAVQAWIDAMAGEVESAWQAAQPERPVVLGMDTGGLSEQERSWILERPYFDLLIYGKKHTVAQARAWRAQYLKPYVPQESWDDDGTRYGYRHPSMRVHTRKYMLEFLMARCQQLDLYVKPRPWASDQLPGYDHNYDPNGWNPFEDDALVMRALFDGLTDYPNLDFAGGVTVGPGAQRYVLSSASETLVYLSSATGAQNVGYPAAQLTVEQLATSDGSYQADLIDPAQGIVDTQSVDVADGRATVDLPTFTDELVVHMHGGWSS